MQRLQKQRMFSLTYKANCVGGWSSTSGRSGSGLSFADTIVSEQMELKKSF